MKLQEKYTLGLQSTAIEHKFDDIVGDLLFLSHQNELQSYLAHKDERTIQAMKAEYIAMSASKKIYDQIRYLDAGGMEKARVDFAEAKPRAVHEANLQDKSGRYYFQDTFKLGVNEIFISPLDLNVEQGKVELPFKPMIRFGTPVFDDTGNKRGIVLLNYLAADLLDGIEAERTEAKSELMLINTEGYWLLHPEKEKEWGFMFEDRAEISFARAFPEEWRMIKEERAGQIKTENGLFTFTTINPAKEDYRCGSGSGGLSRSSAKILDSSEYFWVILSRIPPSVMTEHTRRVTGKLFLVYAGLFLLIFYGAWHLALAITKRRIYQAQLVEMALYDSLTGLPNRKLFFDRLESGISHAARHGRKLGLLYIDLDGFKGVNDTMGHDAGDELLIQVGDALKNMLRKADTVARLGGDEFSIILLEIKELEDVRRVGEKVVANLCRPFKLKAGTARIGASVGAAIFPDHDATADALIKQADTAMYQAKAKGKNTCVVAVLNDPDNKADA